MTAFVSSCLFSTGSAVSGWFCSCQTISEESSPAGFPAAPRPTSSEESFQIWWGSNVCLFFLFFFFLPKTFELMAGFIFLLSKLTRAVNWRKSWGKIKAKDWALIRQWSWQSSLGTCIVKLAATAKLWVPIKLKWETFKDLPTVLTSQCPLRLNCTRASLLQWFSNRLSWHWVISICVTLVQLKGADALGKAARELAVIHVSLAATYTDLRQHSKAVEHYRQELALRQGSSSEVNTTTLRLNTESEHYWLNYDLPYLTALRH